MLSCSLAVAFLLAITSSKGAKAETTSYLESYEATRLEVLKRAEESFGWSFCTDCAAKSNFCCSDKSCARTPSECFGSFGAAVPQSFRIEQTSNAYAALMLTDVAGADEHITTDGSQDEAVMLAAGFLEIDGVVRPGFYGINIVGLSDTDLEASVVDADGSEVAVLRGSRNASAGPIVIGDWIISVSSCCICIWDSNSPFPTCTYEFCWCD